jgi:hypothetical protein
LQSAVAAGWVHQQPISFWSCAEAPSIGPEQPGLRHWEGDSQYQRGGNAASFRHLSSPSLRGFLEWRSRHCSARDAQVPVLTG